MIDIKENVDLKTMTTFGLPAVCGRLIEFSNPKEDLPELDRQGLLSSAVILGGGSNMLFTSGDCRELTVIHPVCREVSIVSSSGNRDTIADPGTILVRAEAGVILDDLCKEMSSSGYWGLENLSGIPGQVGGATVQNVGAYGAEFKDVVDSVICYSSLHHKFITFSNEDCHYGYRDSVFKHQPENERLIVCDVILKLSSRPNPRLGYKGLRTSLAISLGMPEDAAEKDISKRLSEESPMVIRDAVIKLRDTKLPNPGQTGSAGSFFKNPVVTTEEFSGIVSKWESNPDSLDNPLPYHVQTDGKVKLSAAWMIDKSGCKPFSVGGASLWPSQPLVLVNRDGHATGREVVELERKVIDRVYETFGIKLSPEVIHIS